MADDSDYNRVGPARICIDFGTALSKASICLDPLLPLELGVRPLAIGAVSGADQSLLTPSVLYVDGGRLFFGPDALARARAGVTANRDPLLSFKTALGAKNVPEALAMKIAPSVDPTGTLRQRDALVLYLAYLDQLIREAIANAPNMPPSAAHARRRYTSPVWRQGDGRDPVFEGIFNEAAAVSQKLGRLFLAPEGISIAQCKDALDKAAQTPGDGRLETGIFEPHAAAAACLAFTNAPTRFVLVFDMGAGTTDIAAFDFDERTDPPSLTEIKEARQCSGLAGDEIDRVLIDLHVRKRGAGRSRAEDLLNLRISRLAARELKRELFTTGKCALRIDGKTTIVHAKDLFDDKAFRDFVSALGGTFARSLQTVIARAETTGGGVVDVVLAGGGSHLPFLPDLVRQAAQLKPTQIRIRVGVLSPNCPLYDGIDKSLGGVFSQLAMSIGGALVELMPAR
jgi:molecular chaperone DnaK